MIKPLTPVLASKVFQRALIALLPLLWLMPLVALANNYGPISRGDLLKNRQYQSAGTLNLFVDGASGNDGNSCLATGADACATIQGAINKLPKMMTQGPAVITVASGNYTGAYLDSFRANNGYQTTGTYVQLQGTLTTATVATGSATGTATAGTAGSNPTFGTLTDSTQSWTINDLRGKILEITGGTGSGQTRTIQSNTATVITIVGTMTAPTASSTYAIRDWGTTINTAVNTPAQNTYTAATSTGAAGIWVGDVGRGEARVTIRWMKFTTAIGVKIDTSARVLVQDSRFETTGFGGVTANRGSLLLTRNSVSVAAGVSFISTGSNNAIDITATSNLFRGASGTGNAIGTNSPLYVLFSGNAVENLSNGFNIGAYGQYVSFGDRYDTISGNCIGFDGQGTAGYLQNTAYVFAQNPSFNSCGVAINARANATVSTNALTGSGNTTIYRVYTGGRISLDSASTITGTTDIDQDGATYTLAALRAAPGKAIVDLTTLSKIWEN